METISRLSIPGLLAFMAVLVGFAWAKLRANDRKRGAICRICGLRLPKRSVSSEEPRLCERGHTNP